MTNVQFLTLPWNLDSSDLKGQRESHGVPIHALDTIEIASYTGAEKGRGSDITLRFNNGAVPITSKGNAVEVLTVMDEKKEGGLAHSFVLISQHRYVETSTGGIGHGWAKFGGSKIMSVPDFLKRNA
ncbi:MAG: hypothetical protein HRT94_02070 [Alphaproteobacteria bacterium]|nr:hypothetical protein [Alphaproteobacteria bacterium]